MDTGRAVASACSRADPARSFPKATPVTPSFPHPARALGACALLLAATFVPGAALAQNRVV